MRNNSINQFDINTKEWIREGHNLVDETYRRAVQPINEGLEKAKKNRGDKENRLKELDKKEKKINKLNQRLAEVKRFVDEEMV